MFGKKDEEKQVKYPGKRMAMDGNTAVIMCEREASDAAGAYPITPSTQMGEYWAEETAKGHINVSDHPLVFVEPESEHAAAAVTAGMSMSGLRAVNFSSSQGIAFMHESLFAAVGKRLPYVLNIGARAITKSTLNVHAGHDDYHCIDDTGFCQLFGKSAQEAADLSLIGRKIAELSLTPAAVGQDGFLTTHLIEPLLVPERELIAEYLGRPDDIIECPTPAQRMIHGETRRRVPILWDVDNPVISGPVQNQDAYMQSVAGQRPYFFDHVEAITDDCMDEFFELTGRRYQRASGYDFEDAEYVILGQGSMVTQAEAVADYLRETRKIKVGVVNLTMWRPFPGALVAGMLEGKRAVAVLERTDQPLAEDLPIMREVRAALGKALENGSVNEGKLPYPDYPVYAQSEMPRLYSGCYGLGSRDLQPEGLIAAVENMLPDGAQRKFYYLSVDFVRDPIDPKDEIRIQHLRDAYPKIGELALRGSENPNLLPEGSITVRMHSVGGWGAVTTGKNLAMTLYELLGFDIRANPKYGSEKKGQPTTYFLSAAPGEIRLNCEYTYVDVVMSPDPNVFTHSNPLSGLDEGGCFIIQSYHEDPAQVWATFPPQARNFIVEHGIRCYFMDGFKIAREEASNPELQYRMQGNAFQGAFFAASPLMERSGLDEAALFKAIEEQLRHKFGAKGERVVQDNLRIVRRGFDEVTEIPEEIKAKALNVGAPAARKAIGLPVMLKQLPEGDGGVSDVHRFWEQTGVFYATGRGSDNLVDPHMALSLMPAATGVYRDMTQIRFEYPKYVPENCTACGNCFSACPDSAVPGLVNSISDVFAAGIARVERGMPTQHLRRETRAVEKRLRTLVEGAGESCNPRELLDQAVLAHLAEYEGEADQKAAVEAEFGLLMQSLGDYQLSITKPYWSNREKKQAGSGGLFSITVNPYTCKGCMECVEVCDDEALVAAPQTTETIEEMKAKWDFWLDLPNTDPKFVRIDDLNEKVGALETLLLDKTNYRSMVAGDGSCMGCGEKTILHLFTSTVTALMQPRVEAHLAEIDDLVARLETHIRLKIAEGVDLSDTSAINKSIDGHRDSDLTIKELSADLAKTDAQPVDQEWLKWATGLLEKLRHLKAQYTKAQPRAEMGVINSTGCSSVWGSTWPYNPYPFPWSNHLFQDSPSIALGVFEGHMRKMAEGFKAVRMAKMELEGNYNPVEHESFFTYFDWRKFSDDEWLLCPPVVAVGGDGAMYDIGFQNVSRVLASGHPVKIMVLDTQVYSNTGGQACTSGFIGQVADMSPYGKAWKGKREQRKELGLIGMAHRTSFVLNSAISHMTHLLEGYIDGLNSRRPALFNIYAACQPEHGIGDDQSTHHSRMAVESRAYPLFRYDPDAGSTFEECCSVEGNPDVDADWIEWTIKYQNEKGEEAELSVPFTFADFAMTESRFRKHFRKAPPETWNDQMVPLAELLEIEADEREGLFPFVWGVDAKNRLMRVLVSDELVRSCEERRGFWTQIRGICGEIGRVDVEQVRNEAKADMAQRLTSSLLAMAGGDAGALAALGGGNGAGAAAAGGAEVSGDWEPVWVETPECTACDECTNINPKIFKYNADKKIEIADPKGGPYKDIVKAAEKCTAGCIHPGTPWNPSEKGLDKLVKRAEKYQ